MFCFRLAGGSQAFFFRLAGLLLLTGQTRDFNFTGLLLCFRLAGGSQAFFFRLAFQAGKFGGASLLLCFRLAGGGLAFFLGFAFKTRYLGRPGLAFLFRLAFQAGNFGGRDGGRCFWFLLRGNGDGALGEPDPDQGVVVFVTFREMGDLEPSRNSFCPRSFRFDNQS